jgi:hypothetical protein
LTKSAALEIMTGDGPGRSHHHPLGKTVGGMDWILVMIPERRPTENASSGELVS